MGGRRVPQSDDDVALAMYRRVYFEIQELLDEAIGSKEGDGAGEGLVQDVAYVIHQRDRAWGQIDLQAAAVRAALEFALKGVGGINYTQLTSRFLSAYAAAVD